MDMGRGNSSERGGGRHVVEPDAPRPPRHLPFVRNLKGFWFLPSRALAIPVRCRRPGARRVAGARAGLSRARSCARSRPVALGKSPQRRQRNFVRVLVRPTPAPSPRGRALRLHATAVRRTARSISPGVSGTLSRFTKCVGHALARAHARAVHTCDERPDSCRSLSTSKSSSYTSESAL